MTTPEFVEAELITQYVADIEGNDSCNCHPEEWMHQAAGFTWEEVFNETKHYVESGRWDRVFLWTRRVLRYKGHVFVVQNEDRNLLPVEDQAKFREELTTYAAETRERKKREAEEKSRKEAVQRKADKEKKDRELYDQLKKKFEEGGPSNVSIPPPPPPLDTGGITRKGGKDA